VELGQTVNAGFSAPTLFELAGDLGRLVAIANVDESDIGQVKLGQKAELSVMAWPDRSFVGTVRQIRLASTLDQSVVTYPVVIDVENPDGALLPGMTSTVEVVVAEAPAVLCAPNAALRYSPDPDLPVRRGLPEAGKSDEGGKGGGPGRAKGRRRKSSASNEGTVWALVEGQLESQTVAVGLRGAECAEISGEGLAEGLELVLGVERGAAEGASPFGGGSSAPRRPGGF
jgi:HlyD family secretion protein